MLARHLLRDGVVESASMKTWRIWVWGVSALTGAMLLWQFVPPTKFGGVLSILFGISFIADFAWTARSDAKAGKPSKPWALAFFVACGLAMMIGGGMSLLEN